MHMRITPAKKRSMSNAQERSEVNSLADDDAALSKTELNALKKLINYYEQSFRYLTMRNRPWRVIWMNLLAGMARGFGIAIGLTVIAFIAVKILAHLQVFNLPFIGNFIAELLDYINTVQNSKII